MGKPFELDKTFVHLGLGATAELLADFSWEDEDLDRYVAAHVSDGDDGRLVLIGEERASWTSWERHPAGDEVVVALSGRITVIRELEGRADYVELGPGQAVVNPRGVWHTCDVLEPGRALYITPGRGTEHRPRAPG